VRDRGRERRKRSNARGANRRSRSLGEKGDRGFGEPGLERGGGVFPLENSYMETWDIALPDSTPANEGKTTDSQEGKNSYLSQYHRLPVEKRGRKAIRKS